MFSKIDFSLKSDASWNFKLKIWRVVEFLIQNLKRRKKFNSKSCFLNLLFRFLLHCYQSGTTCRFMAWCKKIFLRLCIMCLSHNLYHLFGYCVFYDTWVLVGSVDYMICTTNWFIQISLEFRKRLVYKDLILKDTKLLSKLPWPSRKQSTLFISSNSNLVFLTFSIPSANTEPLVCVVFVFRKELDKWFLYFFLKSLFFAMLGILSTPLFCD